MTKPRYLHPRYVVPLVVAVLAVACGSGDPGERTAQPLLPSPAGDAQSLQVAARGHVVPEEPWWDGEPEESPPGAHDEPVDANFVLSGDVVFEVDSAALTPSAASQLTPILTAGRQHPGAALTIVGHTDSDGDENYNLDLSLRRAETVAAWLADRGVDQDRIAFDGRGETNPIAPNDTPENKAKNRRVEITLTEE